jgi:hypothetical protein
MHDKIDQRRCKFQRTLGRFYQLVEAGKSQWKDYLANRMETKVNCILMEQLQKYEISGTEYDKARHELDCIRTLIHCSNNQPLIYVSHDENNQVNFDEPRLVFPTVLTDFSWERELPTENMGYLIEWLDQQQTYSHNIPSAKIPTGKCDQD